MSDDGNHFTGHGYAIVCRHPAMDTWEYTCNQNPQQAFNAVRFYVRTKVLELGGGAALNGEGIDLDFIGFAGLARIRFSKTKEGSRVSVTVPDPLREKVSALMGGLVAKRKLKSVIKNGGPSVIEKKNFTKAVDVLKTHLANADFSKHIEIMPEALLQAESCLYEHDGKLDKALTHLAVFAAKRAGKNIPMHRLKDVARDSALGNLYRPNVSDTVVRVHGDHYRFEYGEKKVLFAEHITLGGGYPKECMSIHFIWDEARAKLVIGYFGQHLPTSMDK